MKLKIKETWKPIKGFEDRYSISNFGRVRSNITRILKTYINNTDRGVIQLRKNGKSYNFLICRLVAREFIGEWPKGLEVNHKDGNHHNNKSINLEYLTKQQNIEHACKNNLNAKGEKSGMSKLKEHEVIAIKQLIIRNNLSLRKIATIFNVKEQTISSIKFKRSWRHI